ncbi:hypothetical protein AQUCO_02700030v1, partial [Aquilegia coerulea]
MEQASLYISCQDYKAPALNLKYLSHFPTMIQQFAWVILLFLFVINIDDNMLIHGQCLEDQSSSLLQLKQSLSFSALFSSTTSKLSSWNSTRDCCSWDGVTCDGVNGHVIGLDLSEEFISGGVDNSIGLFKLTYLERLNLAYNEFSPKPIPLGLDRFYNLTHLNLSNSGFTGQVPIGISRMKRLVSLDLSTMFFSLNPLLKLENPNLRTLVRNLSELRELNLDGVNISMNIFQLPLLRSLDISVNPLLQGSMPELLHKGCLETLVMSETLPENIGSHTFLSTIVLTQSGFSGPIPPSMSKLTQLLHLDLSVNKFTGPVPHLNFLRNNSLNGSVPAPLFTLPTLKKLDLSQNQFTDSLDLSTNRLEGTIPLSIFRLPSLKILSLSSNNFSGTIRLSINQSRLGILDLSNNQIRGKIDLEDWLTSVIPVDIGSYLEFALFISLSHNFLSGEIPMSICEATSLQVLDLSNNSLTGSVPRCLSSNLELRVLKLRNNNLHGIIPEPFRKGCGLRTLDLNGNRVQGDISKTLSNCTLLEILDLGNNQISGTFPSWLGELAYLRVLVLRSNNFYGHIEHQQSNSTFNMFQIIDLSSNKFTGSLPAELFLKWKGMMTHEDNYNQQILRFKYLPLSDSYYQDVVTVTNKGMQMELVKISTIFTSIDLSNNQFEGEIPQVIGDLTELYVLNLSHNALTGSIPSSLGNFKQLESLDLSDNKLSGGIPKQLADLTFLAVLNLSFNQLVGRVPEGAQFQTFNNASFEENYGLCGPPLSKSCRDDVMEVPLVSTTPNKDLCKFSLFKDCIDGNFVDWQLMSVTIGFGVGIGIAIYIAVSWPTWNRLCVA